VSAGGVIVVVLGIIAVVAVVGWFLLRRNEPENAASRGTPDRTGSAAMSTTAQVDLAPRPTVWPVPASRFLAQAPKRIRGPD
jgi:hypothetical protein